MSKSQEVINCGLSDAVVNMEEEETVSLAREIVAAAHNDFQFPLVLTEGGQRYWVRWAPVIENPHASGPAQAGRG